MIVAENPLNGTTRIALRTVILNLENRPTKIYIPNQRIKFYFSQLTKWNELKIRKINNSYIIFYQ